LTNISLLERTQTHLDTMRLVEGVSRALNTISWIWGGFVTDIYTGQILREHDDLDYLTLDLHSLNSKFAEEFSGSGWQVKNLVNGDLKLKKDSVRVHLGNVELGEIAKWTHNGEKGSLLFPDSWLRFEVVRFSGVELHVIAPELQYVLKEHPEMLNPDWRRREKDILDKKYLRDILAKKGVDVCSLYKFVISSSEAT
jgi:hypothetical protein